MAKPEYVHLLVNSMTKSEKRFYKLFSQTGGDKDYQLLYRLMQKMEIDSKNLRLEFNKKRPEGNFNTACQHLYNSITRCLVLLEGEKDIENVLLNGIAEAKVLFSRDLYEECFNVVRKAKISALRYEKFGLYLILCRLELKFLDQLEYSGINENYIIRLNSKIEQISRQQRAIDNHSALYDLIHYRQLTQGPVGDKQGKDKLNDLVFNELQARSHTRKDSFEAQKLHLLFQSAYFMLTANPKSSLKVYNELNNLFEENKAIWGQPPILYLQHLRGILNNLRMMERYDEMQFFIAKAKEVETRTKSTDLLATQMAFLFESLLLTDTGKYAEADEHYAREGDVLLQKAVMLPLSAKAELFYQVAVIKFGNRKNHEALKTIRSFLNMSKNFLSLPVIKMIRMFHLIIHFEMQHFDYLVYEIKSFERELRNKKKLHEGEKLLFRFIRQYIQSVDKKERKDTVFSFLNELRLSRLPHYDYHLFGNFRFSKWLEGKN